MSHIQQQFYIPYDRPYNGRCTANLAWHAALRGGVFRIGWGFARSVTVPCAGLTGMSLARTAEP
jgi:hypothetical protein